jgi:hypothetical protein
MTNRYQQLRMEFGGEEVAAESLREALKYARRAVARGDKITHPDVVMLLDMFEMESGHEPGKATATCDCEALQQRIGQLEEELKIRANALTRRVTQVSVLQTDLEAANDLIEKRAREARDWERRWQLVTDTYGELQQGNRRLQDEDTRLREENRRLREAATSWPKIMTVTEGKLADTLRANKQQKEKLRAQEAQLEAQAEALKVAEDKLVRWRKHGILPQETIHPTSGTPVEKKFAAVLAEAVPFFARKNQQYGNAIESTGVRGSVVALTGDVARLRVMLKEPVLDIDNIRDKLQDVLVQAGIGIVLLEAGNVDGKGV